jgi:2-dehydropantoate 2-reductase
MKPSICIFGAGAVGGYIASKLETAGTLVSVVARGPQLAAIQHHGLLLQSEGKGTVTHPNAVVSGEAIGPQDYLLITLKTHSIRPALEQLRLLVGPRTTIVAMENGIPWWYTHGLPDPFTDRRIETIDPGGDVWAALPPAQCLGCVLYLAADVPEPGVVNHMSGNRVVLGEPDGALSDRVSTLSALLFEAGIEAPVSPAICDEIWLKLRANMAVNPISALTTATMDLVTSDKDSLPVVRSMMREGQAVGEALGVRFATSVEEQIEQVYRVGHHKTSMLQDLEQGRSLEVEAILGSVVEMAGWVGVDVPTSEVMLGLLRQRAAMSHDPT